MNNFNQDSVKKDVKNQNQKLTSLIGKERKYITENIIEQKRAGRDGNCSSNDEHDLDRQYQQVSKDISTVDNAELNKCMTENDKEKGEDSKVEDGFIFIISIPVIETNFSVLENDFDNSRSSFNKEMKLIEDEIKKFHKEAKIFFTQAADLSEPPIPCGPYKRPTVNQPLMLAGNNVNAIARQAPNCNNSNECCSSSSSKHTCSDQTSSKQAVGRRSQPDLNSRPSLNRGCNPKSGPNQKLGKQKNGGVHDKLTLSFNIGCEYKPDEVCVKCDCNTLQIRAVHVELNGCKKTQQEYSYDFELPKCVEPDKIKSTYKNGVVTIEVIL